MIRGITACFNWSGKHASSNDLFTINCTTAKNYIGKCIAQYLTNQQEPDQASSFFIHV